MRERGRRKTGYGGRWDDDGRKEEEGVGRGGVKERREGA